MQDALLGYTGEKERGVEMEKELVPHQPALTLFGKKFELYPNGLIIHGEPTDVEFDEAFRRLAVIESATAWWYGDLANARENIYGSLKEMASRLEMNYNTLRVYQSVAGSYELLMRINSLSFNHHQIAAPLEDRLEWLQKAVDKGWSTGEFAKQIRLSKVLPPDFDVATPAISNESYATWLLRQPDCDLLLTDPPYSTEIKDIEAFALDWLPRALSKVKPTGRAYIFIGAYPEEITAYMKADRREMSLANLMVWEYKNTIGPAPKYDYKLNWQAILYFRGTDAVKLDCPILTEQFTVHGVNAPDGRTGIRYNEWQKPEEIAERFIRHSTKPGQLVLDCFAGTGTFLISAAKFKRNARGCDVSQEMIDIAISRGCQFE